MPLTRAEAIDASFPQASDFRKHNAGIFPREGVYPDPTTIATAGIAYAGSGWTVGARAFVAEVKRGGAPFTQAYGSARVSNDSNVAAAWTISAAPASGARIDLLCIRVRDTTQGDSSSGAPTDGPSGAARTGFPEFVVVTGTAGTTPARPALPAGYEEIASIQTPAGAASTAGSTITQTYDFAYVLGGPIYYRTIAAMNADTFAYPAGTEAYAIAEDRRFLREAGSTAWRPRERIATYTIKSDGVPDNTVISSAAMTAVTAETTDSSFITGSTGTALTLKRGLYFMSLTFFAGAAMSGRSFAEVRKGGTNGTLEGRDYGANGEDTITVTVPVYIESDGLVVYLQFLKVSGAASNVTGRVKVVKVA